MEDCLNDMLVLQVDECFNWIFLFLISMKCNQQEKSFLYSTLFLVFTLFVWIYFDLKKKKHILYLTTTNSDTPLWTTNKLLQTWGRLKWLDVI